MTRLQSCGVSDVSFDVTDAAGDFRHMLSVSRVSVDVNCDVSCRCRDISRHRLSVFGISVDVSFCVSACCRSFSVTLF